VTTTPTPTSPLAGSATGLVLRDVSARFGGLVALDGVSLTVPTGQIVGVIGPNGAGKTTLFNIVCGFVRPTSGEMTWDGRPLRPRPHSLAALGIGRTLQGVGLFAGLTVVENVMAGATVKTRAGFVSALFGLPRSDRDERALRAEAMRFLNRFGVASYADAYPVKLPFGVQKRVALARALIAEPRLLLLDEPAAGLAIGEIDELAQMIRALPSAEDRVCSVMLVEHHMDLVMDVCDEITVLDFGRVIAAGRPDDIRSSGTVARAYLGAES
jgi:branched-chain amino acid transport system ATP-binding protein